VALVGLLILFGKRILMENKILALILFALLMFVTGCNKEEKSHNTIADSEGNIYKTVKIGTQVWMAENLRSTKFNDGKDIPLVSNASMWNVLTTAGFCWYNNDSLLYHHTFGALYNGYTITTGNLCPVGWHVPAKDEWLILREFLGDSTIAGGKLKEAGTAHWLSPNKDADNSSGFTAVAAGIRYFEGTFSSSQTFTSVWSGTEVSQSEAWSMSLYFAEGNFTMSQRSKKYGFSVRCLKD
jgi:uncharacterized protein (TIGR02145 family)